ncbi:MAG: spore cortex biosynthesis protein YabQ, partial [Firmicutes bacterium]|nr:spore cortex biosynthesis protein YabQ [Bacillota bacterium]
MESVRDQLSTLIHMIAGGLITGFLFDLYRLVRGVIRPHRFITDLGDLLFWAV